MVQVPAMLCNPNLLDNWYFVRAVNQRGQTNYTAGYTIDRWRTYTESASVTVSSGTGVTVTLPQTTSYFSQLLENPQDYRGKTLAASVQGSGNIVVIVTVRKGDQYTTVCAGSGSSGFVTATGTVPNEAYDELRFNIGTGTAGQAIQLKARRLYTITVKDANVPVTSGHANISISVSTDVTHTERQPAAALCGPAFKMPAVSAVVAIRPGKSDSCQYKHDTFYSANASNNAYNSYHNGE